MIGFGELLGQKKAEYGALCLGIDPSETELNSWGLPDNASGAKDFGLRCIDAADSRIGIIKPQVAFFERFGSAGYLALEEVLQAARDMDLLVIADAKRGDIGSTMLGYAQAWFGDDSPLRVNALTVSPYLGADSALEMLDHARDISGGIFMLAATSNQEANVVQASKTKGQTVAMGVLRTAMTQGASDFGVVIGATQSLKDFGLEEVLTEDVGVPILAPGFGAQGADLADLKNLFGASAPNVVANMSRGLTSQGPQAMANLIDRAKLKL
ncbi:MAG: orotidine-5'-phosphate decarboxylase [Aquiluna sp.]|nr:orotidine-5'-phosphate decarboxylase [Aquiluna sp.]